MDSYLLLKTVLPFDKKKCTTRMLLLNGFTFLHLSRCPPEKTPRYAPKYVRFFYIEKVY